MQRMFIPISVSTMQGKATWHKSGYRVNNLFAVHKENTEDRNRMWTITHLPTGHAVFCRMPTRKSAAKLAKLLTRQFPIMSSASVAHIESDPKIAKWRFWLTCKVKAIYYSV